MTKPKKTYPVKTDRILVATCETQGTRKNDFCFAPEEEPVTFPMSCDGGRVDDRCGCRRCMTGVASLKTTTTMRVAAFEGTAEDLHKIYEQYYVQGGWGKHMQPEAISEAVEEDVRNMLHVAATFPLGTIVERRGIKFCARSQSEKK